ncbi:MAG: glyoxalase [Bacteroidota bacterium]
MKLDPIIGVESVRESAQWYQNVFACRSAHGGDEFDILISNSDDVLLCLHKWGAHDHPTLMRKSNAPGNGLILYFRVRNLEEIRERLRKMTYDVEQEIILNANSNKMECSVMDPDGYLLIISEYHTYQG